MTKFVFNINIFCHTFVKNILSSQTKISIKDIIIRQFYKLHIFIIELQPLGFFG